MAKDIFKYLNEYRNENGLPAFMEGEPKMWEAAQIRAHEIVIEFDHWRPNNRSWNDVMWEVGINDNYTRMGECLSNTSPWNDAKYIAYFWDRSPDHKDAILQQHFTTAAIGFVDMGEMEGMFTVLIMTDNKK
jgi:uncharacterized protein YkwD